MSVKMNITAELSEETMAILVEEIADLVSANGIEGDTFVTVTLETRRN